MGILELRFFRGIAAGLVCQYVKLVALRRSVQCYGCRYISLGMYCRLLICCDVITTSRWSGVHVRGNYVANNFFATYCSPPNPTFFSSRITHHGPGIGHMKMPLGIDGPWGYSLFLHTADLERSRS